MTTNFGSVTSGSLTDVNVGSTSDINDFISLGLLNGWTYQNANYYTSMKDKFVFDSSACPSGYTVYLSSNIYYQGKRGFIIIHFTFIFDIS